MIEKRSFFVAVAKFFIAADARIKNSP